MANIGLGSPGQVVMAGVNAPYYANMQNTFYNYDDFLYAEDYSGNFGIYLADNSGAGAGIGNYNGTAGHPGILQMTAASGGHAIAETYRYSMTVGGGPVYFDALMYIPALSTGSEGFVIQLGFSDAFFIGGETNGIYFTYTDSVNSGQFQCVTNSSSTLTTTNTSVAVVANTYYHLNITVNSNATSVAFNINGVNVATNTTNIPSSAMKILFGLYQSVGSSAVNMAVDCVSILQIFSTPRY